MCKSQWYELEKLLKILGSESVYYALRYAVKNPEKTGMDECKDGTYLDLYDIVAAIDYDNHEK